MLTYQTQILDLKQYWFLAFRNLCSPDSWISCDDKRKFASLVKFINATLMCVHAHASVNIYRWKSTAWIGTWSQLNFEDFWRTYIFHIYRFLSEQIHNHLLKHWLNEMEVQINEHTCWILCSSVDVGEKHMILLAIWHCFRIYVTMLVPCLGQFTDVVGMYSAMIQCNCQIYFVSYSCHIVWFSLNYPSYWGFKQAELDQAH